MSQSLRFSSLALFALSTGCSDLWTTYQIEENVPEQADLASAQTCANLDTAYTKTGTEYTVCCDTGDDRLNANNTKTTFTVAQREQGSATIKLTCIPKTIEFVDEAEIGSATALPEITKTIVVEGGGHTLLAKNNLRFFRVSKSSATTPKVGSLTLRNLILDGGFAKNHPVDFPHGFDLATNPPEASNFALGGSILASGDVTLEQVGIQNSKAQGADNMVGGAAGGAIFIAGATLTLNNAILDQNKVALINDSVPKDDNYCHLSGAAIKAVNSTVKISHSTIVRNENTGGLPARPRGIIDIIVNKNARTIPEVILETSNILNYRFYNVASYASVTFYCSSGAQMKWTESNTKSSTVIDKILNDPYGGSACNFSSLSDNPSTVQKVTSFNAFPSSSASSITQDSSIDDLIINALKWKADGSTDYYNVTRGPTSSFGMPGAVFRKTK